MFSLIHPSRSRPQQSFDNMKRWIQRAASDDFEIIVSLDVDDPLLPEYQRRYEALPHPHTMRIHNNKSSVEAINGAARIAHGNIFIVVSDDQECPINWLPKLQRFCVGQTDFVLKVKDGFQNRIITQPIIDRVYYNRDGYIYHPRFDHLFCDTFFTDVAFKRGRVISKNITFKHNQYSIIGAQPDETYKRNNATYESGKRIYQELKKTVL
jgi:hypothetical protein